MTLPPPPPVPSLAVPWKEHRDTASRQAEGSWSSSATLAGSRVDGLPPPPAVRQTSSSQRAAASDAAAQQRWQPPPAPHTPLPLPLPPFGSLPAAPPVAAPAAPAPVATHWAAPGSPPAPPAAASPVTRSLASTAAAPAAPPAPPAGTPTSGPVNLQDPSTTDELLLALRAEGVLLGLERHWSKIKDLHTQELFTTAQIAWIFAECVRVPALRNAGARQTFRHSGGRAQDDEEVLPLGARVVQLFTNFVCSRIPELTPAQLTSFVEALTSQALPMDEFWLFMMAKKIQDTVADFSPGQIAMIARRYSGKQLEDDEFFGALSSSVSDRIKEFSLSQLSMFLLSCAKIRFLHEELCAKAFPLFEDAGSVAMLDGQTLSATVTAAGLLDWRTFRSMACCKLLASNPYELRMAVMNTDVAMGLALASVYLRNPAGARLLLPRLLEHFSGTVGGGGAGRKRYEVAMIQRRVVLTGLCAAFGVPNRRAWTLSQLQVVRETFHRIQLQLDKTGSSKDAYEPAPSSFHLEVVAVLRLLDVEHRLETPQRPFMLDCTIEPRHIQRFVSGLAA
ncbi:unnamed protein product [Polarella glacialis]|uniref:Uncharacterized protein n=1 Tax=Polarella glacialis TaxID=89957 RepID=A0A813FVQ0_POLGL|nr:unnamed protein product [Polarella glacialis]CAE8687188.1 unnamed protein product [Polarella glacialis]